MPSPPPPIPRYGGYVHTNPNYEDFEMWNSVCEDAEPDWDSRNAEREEREERERVARQAAERERERREEARREQRERERVEREREIREKEVARRESREENERLERERVAMEREKIQMLAREARERAEREASRREQETEAKQALLRKEAMRKEQDKKEKENQEQEEKAKKEAAMALAREAAEKEIQRKVDLAKAAQEAKIQLQQSQMEANDDYCQRWIGTVESGLPSASTSEEQEPINDISADLTRRLLGLLRRRDAEKTGSEDEKSQTEHGESVDPDLAIELEHLGDILRTIAESLRAEQAERRRTEETEAEKSGDTAKEQPPAAGWYGSCISM